MEKYLFFHKDGGYCKQAADPSRPETWPYLREEITEVYLDCTKRFLFSEEEVVQNPASMPGLSRELRKLKELLETIDACYKEKLTRDFALEKMGMSKSSFSALFRNQTGMTYIEYINTSMFDTGNSVGMFLNKEYFNKYKEYFNFKDTQEHEIHVYTQDRLDTIIYKKLNNIMLKSYNNQFTLPNVMVNMSKPFEYSPGYLVPDGIIGNDFLKMLRSIRFDFYNMCISFE